MHQLRIGILKVDKEEGGRTHLVSPAAIAAATAIEGKFSLVEDI